MIVFESARLFWLKVSRAASTTARKVWKPASRGLDVEGDRVRARDEVEGVRGDELAVGEEADRGRLGDARIDRRDGLDRLAEAGRRRRLEPLHEDLVAGLAPDDAGLDLDAPGRRQRRLLLAPAGRVVAVRDEDDPLLHLVGEEGGGEAQGSPDVGRRGHRRGPDPIDRPELLGQPLDEGVRPERDDAGDVAVGHRREALPDEGQGALVAVVADRIGEVDDEDCRQAVDRQDELESRPGRRPGRSGARSGRRSRPAAVPFPSGVSRRDGARR